jgi:uncharacterized protein YcfJ
MGRPCGRKDKPQGRVREEIMTTGKSISIAGIAALAACGLPFANAADFTDLAPVVASTPIYEHVNTPKQECWNETVTYQGSPASGGSPLGAIVGGIAGGVIGHQIGSGRGNAVATGVGAVAGAVIGDKVDPNGGVFSGNANAGPREQVVQRCRTVDNWQEVVRGYNVTYRYSGRDVTIRMPYDPGENVRVGVGVIQEPRRPVSYNTPTY